MSKFKSFLKGNVKQVENETLKLARFDEPIELRVLTSGEADKINERCWINTTGKNGKQERKFDVVKYNREVCVASIVYPDLSNAELQESYKVRGADSLYSEMFTLGEGTQILQKVTDISGLNEDINDEIEEAKN